MESVKDSTPRHATLPISLASSLILGQFLDEIVLNSKFVPFTTMNLSYLKRSERLRGGSI
jgi:hypothetical protein